MVAQLKTLHMAVDELEYQMGVRRGRLGGGKKFVWAVSQKP